MQVKSGVFVPGFGGEPGVNSPAFPAIQIAAAIDGYPDFTPLSVCHRALFLRSSPVDGSTRRP